MRRMRRLSASVSEFGERRRVSAKARRPCSRREARRASGAAAASRHRTPPIDPSTRDCFSQSFPARTPPLSPIPLSVASIRVVFLSYSCRIGVVFVSYSCRILIAHGVCTSQKKLMVGVVDKQPLPQSHLRRPPAARTAGPERRRASRHCPPPGADNTHRTIACARFANSVFKLS
ncbi:unnamed protein product [Euphydryas editha]|uniref:Uncharacterized protein n=1 Tax=Euphydryas editha TaxID=104508 RepID=A0AAU9V1M4_EUPED|nr:unnamed protein product [Euphydryas editha]